MSKFKNGFFLFFIFLILYLPIFYLVYYSFSSGNNIAKFENFSWQHYLNLFADRRLIGIVLNTILIALISATIATTIGTFGAI